MNAPLYTTEILRLAASLPASTALTDPHGRGEKRSPTCGSVIRSEVRLDREGRVTELTQQVQACAFGQASAALVQRFAIGQSREALAGARMELSEWLRGEREDNPTFAVLAPARSKGGRHGAILLPFDALIAALDASGTSAPRERAGNRETGK